MGIGDWVKSNVQQWKETEVPVVLNGKVHGWAKSKKEYKEIEAKAKKK